MIYFRRCDPSAAPDDLFQAFIDLRPRKKSLSLVGGQETYEGNDESDEDRGGGSRMESWHRKSKDESGLTCWANGRLEEEEEAGDRPEMRIS